MEKEFFDFLTSGSITKTFCYGDKSKVIVNKVRYNDKLDIIYALDSYSGNIFDLHTPFKYSGIYDKENNKKLVYAWDIDNGTFRYITQPTEDNEEKQVDISLPVRNNRKREGADVF